ncbi:Threonine/homoserine efflux transporter RhtA [Paucidesulfovibrio gracilis DSM 16080]|uniref:Threonine/homoserine efflux transporter RhtA n=1 Tax=Paucidesulfovibrio gracilis DSM 16080 TaxID=1121449 RepID=A0A1T4YA16_9BACT|nr:DMT family transporter [Paucidesulfovibrio gracilis]SKA98358.1 Threonine/homoserine efflux transporter RhtA [Paucidesulfovibrio gracilis DSM 16080]
MLGTYLRLVATMSLWGGTFIAGRLLSHVGPSTASLMRFTVAGLFMILLCHRLEGGVPRLNRRQILPVLLLGFTGVFLYNYCFFSGLQTVTAGRASLIIAGNPVFIAAFAALFFREGFGKLKAVGLALSITGALTVISRGHLDAILAQVRPGDLFILGCVFAWSSYTLLGKKVMAGLSPVGAVTWSCLAGMVFLLPMALREGVAAHLAGATPMEWGAMLYLGVFGTGVGFSWYYQGIRTLGASRAGVFINLVPVNAVFMGWLLLGEPVDFSLFVGAALIFTGVYLVNRPKNAPAPVAIPVSPSARR